MKSIVIVAPFTLLPSEGTENRFVTLAKLLSRDYKTTLVTSSFCHATKSHREKSDRNLSFELVLIDEPGYAKNIGLKRIFSHHIFNKNLSQFFSSNNFDGVYCAYPTLGAARIAQKYAENKKTPFIIDIQDAWPDAIVVAFPKIKWIVKSVLKPLKIKAQKVFAKTNAMVAVSQTHMDFAEIYHLKDSFKKVVYIGETQSKHKNIHINKSSKISGVYLGSIGHSYDLKTVIDALRISIQNNDSFFLHIIGDGTGMEELKKYAMGLENHMRFHGFLKQKDIQEIIDQCDFAFHAISPNSISSITNKFSTYVSSGLPVLNSSENTELKDIVVRNNLGFNYKSGDGNMLYSQVKKLSSAELREGIANNCLAFSEQFLIREKSYKQVLSLIKATLRS